MRACTICDVEISSHTCSLPHKLPMSSCGCCQDLREMRYKGWEERRKTEGPKKIAEVHAEVTLASQPQLVAAPVSVRCPTSLHGPGRPDPPAQVLLHQGLCWAVSAAGDALRDPTPGGGAAAADRDAGPIRRPARQGSPRPRPPGRQPPRDVRLRWSAPRPDWHVSAPAFAQSFAELRWVRSSPVSAPRQLGAHQMDSIPGREALLLGQISRC